MNISSNIYITLKTHYLDASALVKLLIDSPDEECGRDALRTYFHANTRFYTTSLCFAEALGVLKTKYFKYQKITRENYLEAVESLIWGKIEIDDVPIREYETLAEAKRLLNLYKKIDLSDAMQIVTILKGKYSGFCGSSKSILITADNELAKAALNEKTRVWNCLKQSYPSL